MNVIICVVLELDKCYDRGTPLFFFAKFFQFGSLRPLPKTYFCEKNVKKPYIPRMKTSHGLVTQRENTPKTKEKHFPDDFGSRKPLHSEKNGDEKSATSVVVSVSSV